MQIKHQKEFPLMEKYAEIFKITGGTIFAYDDCIYTDKELPHDLLIHELIHLEQQKRDGLDIWVDKYLNDPKQRLEYEIEAYKGQLQSIKDRNFRTKIRYESATNLSSPLYGGIISKEDALKLLK